MTFYTNASLNLNGDKSQSIFFLHLYALLLHPYLTKNT
ncbi:hypothetical protein SAMN05216474_2012 [Lishizhenia tianjinensis]|uniref:Uncharacterized protein n=1 Tax=Lishizhenia tianjinensis TaxID=477690 RepID=A0A1I7AEM0_9FLAO|nr:hypothetical protein SAMN05216474_2012 [Lishizhenia tianjinensis]